MAVASGSMSARSTGAMVSSAASCSAFFSKRIAVTSLSSRCIPRRSLSTMSHLILRRVARARRFSSCRCSCASLSALFASRACSSPSATGAISSRVPGSFASPSAACLCSCSHSRRKVVSHRIVFCLAARAASAAALSGSPPPSAACHKTKAE